MLQILKLIAPVLFPSWRFFDVIAPSPRIEYATFKNTPNIWQEFRPRPARLSFFQMLKRMVWNAHWNESLFLMSCAERIASDPQDHAIQEIIKRIERDLKNNGEGRKGSPYLQFRLVFIYPDGTTLQRHIIYVSPVSDIGHV
jgi:hypothetical protein